MTVLAPAGTDRDVLAGLVEPCRPMGLDEVVDTAALQTRVDRKYLVPLPVLAQLLDGLAGEWAVLTMARRQVFDYVTIYHDTPDHRFHADHVQGKRHRYKVRTRHYVDTDTTMIEVKAKTGRGETLKHRAPLDEAGWAPLGSRAREFVDTHLGGVPAAHDLVPSVESRYTRATLVHAAGTVRLTCDVDLTFATPGTERRLPPGRVLVETKSTQGRSVADRWLQALGEREVAISKYCAGVALLHGRPAHRWHRTLQRYLTPLGPRARPVR